MIITKIKQKSFCVLCLKIKMFAQFKKEVADNAVNALIQELNTTTKFGLVCPNHNGSHKDLTYQLMTESAQALRSGFERLVEVGLGFEGDVGRDLLRQARVEGKRAEQEMFSATDGVNTHKGALFCIGLFCVALGFLKKRGESLSPSSCGRVIAEACGGLCDRELSKFGNPTTHGEKMFAKYSVAGARALAEDGFSQVTQDFLPLWRDTFANAKDMDMAKTKFLAYVVSNTQDVNVLYRSDMPTLLFAQKKCRDLYDNFTPVLAKETEEWFVNRNLSCGGSADLLALTLFLHATCQEDK